MCVIHSAVSAASEAQALSTPTRLLVYSAFEATIISISTPLKYLLHSAMRIGHDNLHHTHVAVFKWDYVKGAGFGTTKDFQLLAVDILSHDEFKAEMRSGEREADDPTRLVSVAPAWSADQENGRIDWYRQLGCRSACDIW